MEVSIDLGNIWEMLSAIGTLGAVIISLWLSFPSKFVLGELKVNGLDKPAHIIGYEKFWKVLHLEYINKSDFSYVITGICVIINPKRTWRKRTHGMKYKGTTIFLNNVLSIGKPFAPPQKVGPKATITFSYRFDELMEELQKLEEVVDNILVYVTTDNGRTKASPVLPIAKAKERYEKSR